MLQIYYLGCVPLESSGSGSVIQDHSDRGALGTNESTLVMDSSRPLMHRDLSDLGSLLLMQIPSKGMQAQLQLPRVHG